MARITSAKCSAPPSARSSRSTEVMTTWLRPSLATASATFSGSCGSSAPGMPVRTLQKAQARVQVSPMIMKVACFFAQHSPILGQPASSHTVTRPFSLHDVAASRAIAASPAPRRGSSPACAARAGPAGAPFRDGAAWYRRSTGRARLPCVRVPSLQRSRYGSPGHRRPARSRASSRKASDAGRRRGSALPRWSRGSWR